MFLIHYIYVIDSLWYFRIGNFIMQSSREETNQFKEKFEEIKENINKIETLVNMLFVALDNDFEPPEISEIVDYLFIIKDFINNHKKLLDCFIHELNLPDGKAKLLLLRSDNFEKKD